MEQHNNSQQDANMSNRFFNAIRLQVMALLCAGAVVAISVTPAQAGIDEEALFEVSFGAGFAIPVGGFSDFWDTLGAKTGLEMDISGGYFVTPNLSLGLAFEYSQFSIDNPANPQRYRFYSIGVYGKYFTGLDSKVSPYIRVQGGLTLPNFSAPVTIDPPKIFDEIEFSAKIDALIGIGARISTSSKSGVYFEAAYRYKPIGGSTGNFGSEIIELPSDAPYIHLTAGIGFDFGPKQ